MPDIAINNFLKYNLIMLSMLISIVTAAIGGFLAFAGFAVYQKLLQIPTGTPQMQKVAKAIQTGAYAYIKRQYSTVSVIGLIISALITIFLGTHVAMGFILGAVLSSISGILGMKVAINSNVRTAEMAQISLNNSKNDDPQTAHAKGLSKAFDVAIKAGGVTGCLVIGLGLLGLGLILTATQFTDTKTCLQTTLGFSLGASLISVFGRLGGGIFTKAADVGADLVGKLESDIPEDDPRNPAVIADNVGDNVGDCAGMAADIFETYAVSIIAAIQIGLILFSDSVSSSIFTYILGIVNITAVAGLFVTFSSQLSGSIIGTLYKMLMRTIIVSGLGIFAYTSMIFGLAETHVIELTGGGTISLTGMKLLGCVIAGFALTYFLMWITDFYTSTENRPVKEIAKASETGHATNVIYGLSVGMESAVTPVLATMLSIVFCYHMLGFLGIAIAVTSMIALTGIIMTLDAYGPITDNAGGIAEMSGMGEDVRKITDELDAIGNTTKATTKGYAIGSAALAALILFFTYCHEIGLGVEKLSILNPYLLVGLFVGGALPYAFGAISMKAVGKIGGMVVMQVRKQFNDNPGILKGEVDPDYALTVDTITKNSIRAMIFPALLPVLTPVALFGFMYFVDKSEIFVALGGMTLGVLITGLFLALMMTNSGGAWDNAKKYIESGHHGGKGSQAHKAAITGDTVGDPTKDTTGPAINPMIKVIGIVTLLLANWFLGL